MKALLICPSERPAVRQLSEATPLACVPVLGQSLLEYWLSHLAATGAKRVVILAADRPEHVLAMVGNGARWGLAADVIPESRELVPAQALLKYAGALDPAPAQANIIVLDHFPGQAEPLFADYAHWFAAVRAWMPRAKTPERVGLREVQPGVWMGLNAHIGQRARLQAPCWLGNNTFISPDTTIGPGALIEEGSFVEPRAEVAESYVAPHTYVGEFTCIRGSVALANMLIDCQMGAAATVPDPSVLCALRRPPQTSPTGSLLARFLEFCFHNREDVQVLWKHLSVDR